ncbi:MAG: aminomethyl-transferring glycine dehydrogenase [Verrucomicrobiae bacterium]|nr:aminomethyl-transferring glycine dehydrogenase [Verrucomicrobiae bacterium]
MHPAEPFACRHIGPSDAEQREMLAALGFESLDALIDAAIPPALRTLQPLNLPRARTEHEALAELKAIMSENRPRPTYIGQGFYGTLTPPVLRRCILENPAWYTPYTPYQSEISQGRLEALFLFQVMVAELTHMDVANASLLDEASAAAEAMLMCHRLRTDARANTFLVSDGCHPQTIAVLHTRAEPLGIRVVVENHRKFQLHDAVFGALVQYPATDGQIHDFAGLAGELHTRPALLVVATDLLALTLIKPPGEFGADIVVGSAQRFGVPLGYGGPHPAFLATRDAFKRQMPGRLVGVSRDARGQPALRLALQTREQHIRREKATSNICTAQVLPAVLAAMYAVWHGPEGLKRIAERIHRLTRRLAEQVDWVGEAPFFDTLRIRAKRPADVNVRDFGDGTIGVALDETTTEADVEKLARLIGRGNGRPAPALPMRASAFLTAPVFNRYHTELEMMRFLKRLESRDISLCTSMIPLGSCTMKLNSAASMLPLTWPEVADVHPFVPQDQARGYQRLFRELEHWLAEITGMAAVWLQPNAGSQGELAGLLVIRRHHIERGQTQRNVCLIPTSAHGTNPASAALAGMQVVPVACDSCGNVDMDDLRAKARLHSDRLAAIMITYPSTHGVFEPHIRKICDVVHEHGGQVYMDGANLNAMVGLCRPGELGADVCHLNLHKTFGIPHGGGGPGAGPITVAAHLARFLPGPDRTGIGTLTSAQWGSASILTIAWMYIAMMGGEGLTRASKVAVLNANYVAHRLRDFFPTVYRGPNGLVAHECILDFRQCKARAGIEVEDVAKRLMDYGFHAPTMSWPVPGTLMVEPTESESKAELDRFCDALIAIHAEIKAIEEGRMDKLDNPLKNAPHTADMIAAADWPHPYSREQAAFPAPWTRQFKFWPAVARVDNVHGDRHFTAKCEAWPCL